MPLVVIEWYEGRSAEQKVEVAERVTAAVAEVGKVPPEDVWVRFVDVDRGDWAIGGRLQG